MKTAGKTLKETVIERHEYKQRKKDIKINGE